MAINVNAVYRTVLLLLNKEQRGYMTPTEFNNVATQVQLEVFESYFSELNQPPGNQQGDFDYADDFNALDGKISIFKSFANGTPVAANNNVPAHFTLPTVDVYGNTTPFYRLGEITHNNTLLERLQRSTFYNIQRSNLTKSQLSFPTYLFEDQKIFVSPNTINSNLEINYIRTPNNVAWGFDVGQTLGQYIYNPSTSFDFELDISEQTTVILKILFYAGLIIEDPSVIQVAAQQVASQ